MLLPYRHLSCESLRHKSNTFHTNISTLHMFISITFTETSIDETNKTQQKVRLKIYVQNVHHSCEHMHSNDYATAQSLPRWRCACAAASTPSADVLSTFNVLSTHIIDLRAVDPLLKHTPDAVVHRIQIWRIRWPDFWRDKLWRLSLQHGDSVTCTTCWCPILLKNVVILENRADIQQKHI